MDIKLLREKPNVISKNKCWVIIDDMYMYCHENLLVVLFQYIFEHNHDKHLVG